MNLNPFWKPKTPSKKVQGGNLRNSIRGYKKQMKRIRPKFSEAKTSAKLEALKQEYYTCIHNIKLARHKIRNKPSIIANTRSIKIFYIRYADDWILLTNGTAEIANFIKNKISQFLSEKLKFTLSEKKTLITRITKEKAKFLGFELKISPKGRLENKPTGNTKFTKFKLTRLFKGHVWAAPDKQRLINRLHMKGFCNRTGIPKELPWLSCLEPQIIIQRYNSVIIGFAHFYLGYVRNRASIHRWIYILRFSCLKTLAQKYKTSIRDIFKRFGVKLHSKNRQTVQVKVRIKNGDEFFEKSFTLLSYRDLIDRYYNSFDGEPHEGRLSRMVQEQVVRVIKTT